MIVQLLCELADGALRADIAKLEQAGRDHESLIEQNRRLRDLYHNLFLQLN